MDYINGKKCVIKKLLLSIIINRERDLGEL